jgi:PAS domain S-box-containing protein
MSASSTPMSDHNSFPAPSATAPSSHRTTESISYDRICSTWDGVYCDAGDEETIRAWINSLAEWIVASAPAAFALSRHIWNSRLAGAESLCARVADLRQALIQPSSTLLTVFEDFRFRETLCAAPQVFSYLLPAFFLRVPHCLTLRLLDTFDSLPDDVDILHALSGILRAPTPSPDTPLVGILPLLLRQEPILPYGQAPAVALARVDELFEREASPELLFCWMLLPARWRYYLLRDTLESHSGQELIVLIAKGEIAAEGLLKALSRPLRRIVDSFPSVPLEGSHELAGAQLWALPMSWYIDVLHATGVLLLPQCDFEHSPLANLRRPAFRGTERERQALCCVLGKSIRPDAELPREKAFARSHAIYALRQIACTPGSEESYPEEAYTDYWGYSRDILNGLPIVVRLKNKDSKILWQSQAAAGLPEPSRMHDLKTLSSHRNARDAVLPSNAGGIERLFLSVQRRLVVGASENVHLVECLVDVTTREAERALYATVVNAAGVGLWYRELADNKMWLSPGWKHMLGYAEEELSNSFETWKARIHPDDRNRVLAALADYTEERVPRYVSEYRLRHKDESKYVWVRAYGVLHRGRAGGSRSYIAGLHFDVTEERTRAQMQDQALDGLQGVFVFAKNRQLQFTYANKALKDAVGRDPVGLTDKELFADQQVVHLFNESDGVIFGRALSRVIGGQMQVSTRLSIDEEYLDDVNGRRRWLTTVKWPLFKADGDVELVGIAVEMSQLREANMYRDALLRSPVPCYTKNAFGRFTQVNAAFAAECGMGPEEMLNQTDFDLFPAQYAEEWRKEDERIIRGGVPVLGQARLVFAKGDAARVRLVTKLPVLDGSGKVEGIVGIASDVTAVLSESDEIWMRCADIMDAIEELQSCVFVKDQFGRFRATNEAFRRRHLGSDRRTMIGTTDYDWWPREQADRYRADDRRVLVDGMEIDPYVEEQSRDNGKRAILFTMKAPLKGEEGKILAVVGVYEDVTSVVGLADRAWRRELVGQLGRAINTIQRAWEGSGKTASEDV